MPIGILHLIVWGTSLNSLALILKTINLFLPCKFIFLKRYQSWYPSKFFKAQMSVVGNPLTTILYQIIIIPTLNICFKTLHILLKRHQIWFCTRLFRVKRLVHSQILVSTRALIYGNGFKIDIKAFLFCFVLFFKNLACNLLIKIYSSHLIVL